MVWVGLGLGGRAMMSFAGWERGFKKKMGKRSVTDNLPAYSVIEACRPLDAGWLSSKES